MSQSDTVYISFEKTLNTSQKPWMLRHCEVQGSMIATEDFIAFADTEEELEAKIPNGYVESNNPGTDIFRIIFGDTYRKIYIKDE